MIHQSRSHVEASTGTIEKLHDLLDEYQSLVALGKAPTIDAFVAKYPDAASELRRLLHVAAVLADFSSDPTASPRYVVSDDATQSGTLGDFRILGELGRGGMGVVYEAEQISLNRHVALKVLPFASVLDQRRLERFQNEARAAGALHHPNIVPVFSVGCDRGVHYYAMELVRGDTLATLIQTMGDVRYGRAQSAETHSLARISTDGSCRGVNYARAVASLGKQAAEALGYAHSKGIIHRDIKPSNLLLDERGTLRIADFGLAQFVDGDGLSMTGDVLGTLRYMSPEQAEGRKLLDERTDIYSLGITIHELLTLSPAFDGDNRQELLHNVMHGQIRRPSRIDALIPRDIETILLKATAKEAESRYNSMKEFADDLSRFLEHRPIKATRTSQIARLRSWTKRNPVLAASLGATATLLVVLAVLATWAADRQTKLATTAEAARAEIAQLQAATRRDLYASDMLVAR